MERNARQARPTPLWLIWLRAIRPWLWLGVVLVMLVSVSAMLLLPEPGRTAATWVVLICTIEVGISAVKDRVRAIQLDPEKRERFNHAWHTIGARILAAGFVVAAVGTLTTGVCALIGQWTGGLPKDATMVALVVTLIGLALLFVGLVTFLVEYAIRDLH